MRLVPPHMTLASALTGATQGLQNRLQEIAGDVASGRRSDQVGFLKGDIGQAMLAQRALDAYAIEKEQIALRTSRLGITQRSLNSIAEASEGIALDVRSAIGLQDARALAITSDAAGVALERIFSNLNVRHAERHLFSGDATDTPALASPQLLMADLANIAVSSATPADFEQQVSDYFNTAAGGWRSGIYQGTPSSSHPDQVLAIDPALTDLISGLAVIALNGQAQIQNNGALAPETLLEAAGRVSRGMDSVTDLRARVGLSEADLAQRSSAIETEQTLAARMLNDLTARDPFEAAVELRQLETNLESAYALTVRLSELSLLRFLR